MRRWLALAVLAIPMVCGWSVAKGESTTEGLTVVGYSIDQVPPAKSDTAYPVCGHGWYGQINYTWDYEQNLFGECGWDSFMLHYTGFIQIPAGVNSVRFAIASDDGSDVTISGHTFGDWSDKGCSVDYSDRLELDTGKPLELDAWFYENGGGTCFMLMWQFNADNQDWAIVPESAFTFVRPTTTTLQQTTTTTEPPTTSTVPRPVVVVPKIEPVQTVPAVSTSDVSTSTIATTVPSETATTQTSSPSTTSTSTSTTTTTSSTTTSTTTIPLSSTTTPPAPTTTTTLPTTPDPVFQNSEAVAAITNQIDTATPAEAAALFDKIDESNLTPTQAAVLVEAVQSASVEIRKTFEKHINIYEGAVDTYVPVGSKVNVRSRRVIIAVGLVLIVPVAPVRKPNE